MKTRSFVFCDERERNDVIENINSIRSKITNKFQILVQQLREKESELLTKLEEFEANFQSEQDQRDEAIKSLMQFRDITESDLGESELFKSLKHQHITDIELKINEIQFNSFKSYVTLTWNEDILSSVRDLGRIEMRTKIRYLDKIDPIITASGRGSANGEMRYPRGIAIDPKSSNIFIADNNNRRIQVYDHQGQYLYKFSDKGAGRLNYPYGIAIGNDKVYVSQSGPNVYSYDLNGDFLREFGKKGSESEQISSGYGLVVSQSNGDIYVCDWNKNVIIIYSEKLQYKTSFGKDHLHSPRDIQIILDKIFVLDEGDPCIHIFNRDLSYSHSIVSRGTDKAIDSGWFFTLDHEENIIISDSKRNLISIFTHRGYMIHQIGKESSALLHPQGIVLDSMDRIVVADEKQEHSLKMF